MWAQGRQGGKAGKQIGRSWHDGGRCGVAAGLDPLCGSVFYKPAAAAGHTLECCVAMACLVAPCMLYLLYTLACCAAQSARLWQSNIQFTH